MAELNEYCAQACFSVIKLRSENKIKDFGYSRVVVACQRGSIRKSEAHSRSTSTSKVGCPWKGVTKALKENDRRWTFEVHQDHQHHQFHEAEDYEKGSRFNGDYVAFIKDYIDRLAVRNREFAVEMRR